MGRDLMTNTSDIWGELERGFSLSGSEGESRYKCVSTIREYTIFYISILCENTYKRGVVIRYPLTGKKYHFPSGTRGLEIRRESLAEHEGVVDLLISIGDSAFNDIFETFAGNLLHELNTASTEKKDLVDVALAYVSTWKKFMEKISDDALSDERQKGLYGELYYLLNTIIPAAGVQEAINSWVGPEGNPQDFLLPGNIGVEVKTSSAKAPVYLKISNEKQLSPVGLNALYLHYVSVNITNDTINTLCTIADEIREQCLKKSVDLYYEFMGKLAKVNYRAKDREKYENKRYNVTTEKTYLVPPHSESHNFPNITPEILTSGVVDITYSIDVASLNDFVVPEDAVRKNLDEVKKKRDEVKND